MSSDGIRGPDGRFLPGHPGNPNALGRPKGSGHVLAEDFKRDLVEEWRARGAAALKELTGLQLARLVVDALPKELLLQATVEPNPLAELSPDQMREMLTEIRRIRAEREMRTIEQPSEIQTEGTKAGKCDEMG